MGLLPQNHSHTRHLTLHGLVSMTTMMSPARAGHIHPVIQAGGGDATSVVPAQHLYLAQSIQDHLTRVYDSLRGNDPTLSREKLAGFLAVTQRQVVELPVREQYKFEEFLEIVWHSDGFEALKKKPLVEQDLTKPISNYFISSSHNTYLLGNQLSSKSSTEAYKNVLIRGCRCIEIDVWNGEPRETVTGGKPDFSKSISSTAASIASSTVKEALEKYDHAKHMFSDKSSYHHRVPSINHQPSADDSDLSSAIDSMAVSDTPATDKTSLASRSRHNSHSSSHSTARHEPRVLHGWTLTSDVGFRDVCKTIRETAFETSNLPIIVSLEVHADLDQQEIMVDIMKEEWKGLLVDAAHESCNPAERLPRLEELLNKILIKVKKATPITTGATLTPAATLSPTAVSSRASSSTSLAPTRSHDDGDSPSGSEDDRASKSTKSKTKKSNICENLSKLGIYTHSAHFKSFELPEATEPPHIFSISEAQILELHNTQQKEMFDHNRRFFMRAYPSGRRIDSSNPDPSIFWRKGVQMVALNWQSWDEGTMINEGMFAGEHGWVLKPKAYLEGENSPSVIRQTLNLKITVLAAQQIPLPIGETSDHGFHPYVKCEVHVDKPEENSFLANEKSGRNKEGRYKLVTPYGKGDHPNWGAGFVLLFSNVLNVIEDLSFVRFKVEDEKYAKDRLAAWACIRLDRLQEGYRFVKLLNAKGEATRGLLLVRIEKTLK